MLEVIGLATGAVLTLAIFSYLLGDNALYRLALHIFIGAVVGYAFGLVVREVLGIMIAAAWMKDPVGNLILIVPVLIGVSLFFFKSIRKLAYWGNLPVAYLVGVGTAVALAGALKGTFGPQVMATAEALSLDSQGWLGLLKGGLVVFGTICTLLAFDFTFAQRQRGLMSIPGWIIGKLGGLGRWLFLTVALGVAFAGALTAALSMFIGRVQYLIEAAYKIVEYLGL